MGYINNRRNSFKEQGRRQPESYREPFLCAEEIEGEEPKEAETERTEPKEAETERKEPKQPKQEDQKRMENRSILPVDFSNPTDEMRTEKDFRMLQSMYPNSAKELLPFIEEECDRLEYEGSAMFDEYPDFTTIHTLQKKIAAAAPHGQEGASVPIEDLIRVMVLQEMHRRRDRYRFCRDNC